MGAPGPLSTLGLGHKERSGGDIAAMFAEIVSAWSPAWSPAWRRRMVIDLDLVKHKQQAAWSSGDYASVGNRIPLVSELLCETVDVRAGERVLDVATGTGNAALAAARRFADVTGVDYVPALLDRARSRAEVDGLDVDFRVGDAEALEFDDDTFDVVLSACGAMFAPDHRRTASELVRVCRPGGRIGMVNWCPDGYIGELFRAVATHVPPPPGVEPPTRGQVARSRRARGAGDRRVYRRALADRPETPRLHRDVRRRRERTACETCSTCNSSVTL